MNGHRRIATPGCPSAIALTHQRWGRVALNYVGCSLIGVLVLAAQADTLPDNIPPFLTKGVAPNLVISIDDSESMFDGDAPDIISRARASAGLAPGFGLFYMSPHINRLYFDPEKAAAGGYQPAVDRDGKPFLTLSDRTETLADLDPSAVYRYPFASRCDGEDRQRIDLLTRYEPIIYDQNDCLPFTLTQGKPDVPTCANGSRCPVYTRFLPDNGYKIKSPQLIGQSPYESCIPSELDTACTRCGDLHGRYGDTETPDLCFELVEVPDELIDQFAIWYGFYRTRWLMAQTVLSQAMQSLNGTVRVTYQGVGARTDLRPTDAAFIALQDNFGEFDSNKEAFYDWMFGLIPASDNTYLVAAHVRAGEFCRQGLAQEDDLPADASAAGEPCGSKCRHNFHLMITDGGWTDSWGRQGTEYRWPETDHDDGTWIGVNQDGGSTSLPTSADDPWGRVDYDPSAPHARPYADANTGMLADAAFYYWSRDLIASADNAVPPLINALEPGSELQDQVNFWNPLNDPATWQHLSLFTISVAATGEITPTEDRASPFGTYNAKTTLNLEDDGWPSCTSSLVYDGADDSKCTAIDGGQADIAEAAKVDDLYHAAMNGRGAYFNASDPNKLFESLSAVLSSVSADAEQEVANAPVAISGGALNDDSRIYQAVSNAENWTGELRGLQVSLGAGDDRDACSGVPRGHFCEDPRHPYQTTSSAETFPAPSQRRIYTIAEGASRLDSRRVSFDSSMLAQLSDRQKQGLTGRVEPSADVATAYIDWLRGNDFPTVPHGEDIEFREREGKMGDILGSGPIVVGHPAQLFADPSYTEFKREYDKRDAIVYVGANDGMLHAFNADDELKEVFAYVPAAVYMTRDGRGLATLADPAYTASRTLKQPFVDGALSYSDAKIGSGDKPWRSVLVGALGAGAQGIFALDITDPVTVVATPETAAEKLVLWEFTDASGAVNATGEFISDSDDGKRDGRDMGYILGAPAIVQIDEDNNDSTDPTWVVIIGNGYGSKDKAIGEDESACDDDDLTTNCTISQTGNAVMYVLRLGGADDQRVLARLDAVADDATAGEANGLSEVSTLDEDGDLIADRAYAGDQLGHVWRFDLKDLNESPTLVFSATDPDGKPQPISTRIAFTRHPNGGYMLLFGTGRFINTGDKNHDIQTFYGIWDDDGALNHGEGGFSAPKRENLIQHRFLGSAFVQKDPGTVGAVYVSRARTSTTAATSTDANTAGARYPAAGDVRGWFIDLILDPDGEEAAEPEGERVVVAPQVRQGRVVFVSMIPGDCCSAGGESWINALDAIDGSRLDFTPFDFNLDGFFDTNDLIKVAGDSGPRQTGSSIRILTDNGSGIYAAPSTLVLGGGEVMSVISDSEGDLIPLEEYGTSGWRTWLQIE